MGLRALSILDGDVVVFFSGAQIGAIEAYLHALVFSVFGASRSTISIAPLLVGSLTAVLFFLAVRELFGRPIGVLSLAFFALPSPAYLAWTYMPNSYPETLLFCAATFWLAARIANRGAMPWSGLAFGLSVGLGWWNSALTASFSLAAIAWLLIVRVDARRLRFWVLPALGAFLGALPWIAYNLLYRFPSIRQVLQPAGGATSLAMTTRRFFAENLPELAAGANPLGDGRPLNTLQAALQFPTAAVYVAAVWFLVFGASVMTEPGRRFRSSLKVLRLAGGGVAALFIFSASGRFPGPTVRYVLPIFLVLSAALGLLVHSIGVRSRMAGLAAAAVVILFNLSGYYWPWTAQRQSWSRDARVDEQLLTLLEKNRISWICGDYWTVYPFNFLSRGRLKAAPFDYQFDFYGVGRALPASGAPALIRRDGAELVEWSHRAGLSGRTFTVGNRYRIVFPAIEPASARSPERLYALLVVAARGPELRP
jgi:4-amino-4-deoxy-L-arabinose transferase-like glycosyltransferase